MKSQQNDSSLSLRNIESQANKPIERVVFLGTPDFAVPTLEKLAQSNYKPILVVTQPDKKKGRNMRLTAPPVKQVAIEYGIETMQPEDINEEYVVDRIAYLKPDIIITVAYGGFLGKDLLTEPHYGCINLHPSLLPKYRGAAPVNYTLFNNDSLTGNSIIKMVKKMDKGPILYQSHLKVDPADNATTLLEKLAVQGADDILELLPLLEKGEIQEQKQDDEKASYSAKITKEDALINWEQGADFIYSRVRGLAEEPGAFSFLRGQRMKILLVKPLNKPSEKKPGTVVDAGDLSFYHRDLKEKGIVVATGDKDLLIVQVQPAGKRIMTAFEFQLGANIKPNDKFTNEH